MGKRVAVHVNARGRDARSNSFAPSDVSRLVICCETADRLAPTLEAAAVIEPVSSIAQNIRNARRLMSAKSVSRFVSCRFCAVIDLPPERYCTSGSAITVQG